MTATELTSNVAITETEWTAGTYATGVERYVGTDIYEVVATPDTTDEPVAGAAKETPTWIKIGKINRFKMFDFIIGEATEVADSPIIATVNFPVVVNSVALFEVDATAVQVEVSDIDIARRNELLATATLATQEKMLVFAPHFHWPSLGHITPLAGNWRWDPIAMTKLSGESASILQVQR